MLIFGDLQSHMHCEMDRPFVACEFMALTDSIFRFDNSFFNDFFYWNTLQNGGMDFHGSLPRCT